MLAALGLHGWDTGISWGTGDMGVRGPLVILEAICQRDSLERERSSQDRKSFPGKLSWRNGESDPTKLGINTAWSSFDSHCF